jgi:hypothetical protein
MSAWKALLAGAALGVIFVAFRDAENQRWLMPAGLADRLPTPADDELEEEPILGYDGMDEDTLLDWLEGTPLDGDTLMRTRWYEQRHLAREPLLDALECRL